MGNVILVDEQNNPLWEMEKIEAHEKWLLHRAFSIFVFNTKWELLLQQRAKWKYHCPWLWTNTCCSHPYPWESYNDAIHRRLQEEMWFDCDLQQKNNFIYHVSFKNGLSEHEHDTIFVWEYEWDIHPNPEEVESIKWVKLIDLEKDLQQNPENYTPWFRIIFEKSLL